MPQCQLSPEKTLPLLTMESIEDWPSSKPLHSTTKALTTILIEVRLGWIGCRRAIRVVYADEAMIIWILKVRTGNNEKLRKTSSVPKIREHFPAERPT